MRPYLFMKLQSLIICLLVLLTNTSHAGWFSPDNYWECLLDNMHQVQSDAIAEEVIKSCKNEFPFHKRVFVEKKRPWFGVKTASQCVLKHGKKTPSEIAARHIQAACYKLYSNDE